MSQPTNETGPVRPADTAPRCTCGHTKRDHSGRLDHREKHPNIPNRPWCHACETECIYCPPEDPAPVEEPAEPRLTVDTITSDQLDALQDEIATLRRDNGQLLEDQAECIRLEAAVTRVRKLASRWAILRAYGSAATELRKVLDEKEASRPQVVHFDTEQQVSGPQQVDELAAARAAIARVRALRTNWLSTGAPPLGTSIARWWDKRLTELAAALDEPSDGAGVDPPADTARHCGGTLTHPGHKFMRLDVVFNCPGNTPKAPTP